VVYRGDNGLMNDAGWTPSAGWQVGTLAATPGVTPAAGDPFAYLQLDGGQHIIYRGTDQLVHEFWRSASDQSWQIGTLAATPDMPPAATEPHAFTDSSNNQHVIYRGVDGLLHDVSWFPASGWVVGTLAEVPSAPQPAGDPVGFADQAGNRYVFYRGASTGVVEEVFLRPGDTRWSYGNISATPGLPTAGDDPFIYVEASGNRHVVFRSASDGLIYEVWWAPSVDWQLGTWATQPPWCYAILGAPTRIDVEVRTDLPAWDSIEFERSVAGGPWTAMPEQTIQHGPLHDYNFSDWNLEPATSYSYHARVNTHYGATEWSEATTQKTGSGPPPPTKKGARKVSWKFTSATSATSENSGDDPPPGATVGPDGVYIEAGENDKGYELTEVDIRWGGTNKAWVQMVWSDISGPHIHDKSWPNPEWHGFDPSGPWDIRVKFSKWDDGAEANFTITVPWSA
jgi:hypothetical protein